MNTESIIGESGKIVIPNYIDVVAYRRRSWHGRIVRFIVGAVGVHDGDLEKRKEWLVLV